MFIQACVSYLRNKALMATNEDPVAMILYIIYLGLLPSCKSVKLVRVNSKSVF